MNTHAILSRSWNLKLAMLIAMLLITFAGLCGIVTSTAQSAQADSTERKFENTIPAHVPIRVKLKNEQSFKQLENKKWARELAIEIKNTGSKPIYFLYMLIVMPDVTIGSYPYAMQLHYGRKELVRLDAPIQPDDLPINPGETVTLSITENQVKGYEESRDRERRADPKKIKFDMQLINFGDGTGLRGTDARPSPDPARKERSNTPEVKESPDGSPPVYRTQATELCYRPAQSSYSPKPASFMRVNFSLANVISTLGLASPLSDLCGCQNTFNCFFGTIDYATCPCDDPEAFTAFVPTSCSDPFGSCSKTQTVTQTCNTQYNGIQYCQYQEEGSTCKETTPTPTPTPTPNTTPTPTPCATPAPETRPNPSCQPFGPCPPQGTQGWLLA